MSGPQVGANQTTVALSAYRGKVVVVNFWGAWCPACRAETDTLIVASNILQPLGAQFLGLDIKDVAGAGAAYQTQKGMPYPSIEDPGMRTLLSIRGFPSGAIPSTIVLDQEHRIARIWLGPVTDTELVPAVKQLIAEQQSAETEQQSPATEQQSPATR
ncbi:peroxiredoxin [Nakamurella sp. UYEF19]|uniref:TlpA family protein disulfide reductase n=1 Tax=Nakamurella sp. UYEF19 TaxID=1756392 RepID=UPI00339B7AE6